MKRRLVCVLLLWLAFWGGGVMIHRDCFNRPPCSLGWVDIEGYDSEAYLNNFTRIRNMFMVSARHPLMSLMLGPVYAVSGMLEYREVPRESIKTVTIGLFAAFGAASALLLWLILTELGLRTVMRAAVMAMWLSFSHVWLLGGMVESFPVSMTLLLLTVYLLIRNIRDWRCWLALTIVSGGVTLTNGLKPPLAWLVTGGRFTRRFYRVLAVLVGIGAACVGCVLFKWYVIDGYGLLGGEMVVKDISMCFASATFGEHLSFVWRQFLCEPLYGCSPSGMTATAVVLAFALAGVIRNFRHPAVRAILAMFTVDFGLHLVLGWGISEGQIYCGHWFWALPIFVAFAASGRVPEK